MEYRYLGASGFRVPVLSFGTGTFGGQGALFSAWGSTDVAEARRLVDVCLDAGLNMFDSADVYSKGAAEEILGEAIKGRPRDSLIISTKATFRFGDGENQVDVTHVDTAADAHLRALDALLVGRANGKAYFLSQGEPVKLWVFINRLLVGAGEKPLTKRISQRAAYWLGALLEGAWTLFRLKGEPPMTRFVAVELAKDHWFDVSAARRDLGLKPAVETWAELDRLAATLRTK